MYALMNGSSVVGLCEKPSYVYYREIIKAYHPTDDEEQADGIVFQGKLYNFPNSNKIPDAPQVDIVYKDGMEVVFNNNQRLSITEGNTAIIEEAMLDMDEANEERLAVIEDALMELDSSLSTAGE